MLGGVESPTTNSVSLGLGCIPIAKQNLAYRYCSWKNLKVTHFPPYPLFWIHILVAQIIAISAVLITIFVGQTTVFVVRNTSLPIMGQITAFWLINPLLSLSPYSWCLDPLGFPIIFLLYASYYIPVVSLFTICHIVFPSIAFFFPYDFPLMSLLFSYYIYIYSY